MQAMAEGTAAPAEAGAVLDLKVNPMGAAHAGVHN